MWTIGNNRSLLSFVIKIFPLRENTILPFIIFYVIVIK
jgi:hypothetical protein